MSRPQLSEEQKRIVFTNFVSAAWSIIQEEGMEGLTLRKVSAKAGYNSATLYHYFRDLDELSTYAALGYFREWERQLVDSIRGIKDPEERVLAVWEGFCHISFQRPRAIFALFFGDYSGELEEISTCYFALFPHQQITADELATMGQAFGRGNLSCRNRTVLQPLVEAGRLPADQMESYNEIIVLCFKGLLEEKIQRRDQVDNALLTQRLQTYICTLLKH